MTIPPITKKQSAILLLVYRFRFIDRKQLQTILMHKNHRRIHAWLHDLVEKQYLGRIYSKKIPDNTKPAIYYLGKNGRKYLGKHFSDLFVTEDQSDKKRQIEAVPSQLTKTYRDSQRSKVFHMQCLALVDCYIQATSYGNQRKFKSYHFASNTECQAYELLQPFDAYLRVTRRNGTKKRYVFIYLTHRTPRKFLRYRVAEVINFLTNTWEMETDQPHPHIICICSLPPLKNYAKKIFSSKLASSNNPDLSINITTSYLLKTHGMENEIWEHPKKQEW